VLDWHCDGHGFERLRFEECDDIAEGRRCLGVRRLEDGERQLTAGAQTGPGGATAAFVPAGPTTTPTTTPAPTDTGPLPATAGDGIDGMVPAPDLRGSNKATLFEAYTPGSYTWDTTLGATDVTEKGENAIANAVMWVVVAIGTVTARALTDLVVTVIGGHPLSA
jgi:hypothetical protein